MIAAHYVFNSMHCDESAMIFQSLIYRICQNNFFEIDFCT